MRNKPKSLKEQRKTKPGLFATSRDKRAWKVKQKRKKKPFIKLPDED